MTDKIKKLFADSAKKAKRRGEKVGENSEVHFLPAIGGGTVTTKGNISY